jgi:S1-C subfamily serine protease
MSTRTFAVFIVALATACAGSAEAQVLRDVFRRVSSSVVVVTTAQREVVARPRSQLVMAASLGSGVLISRDGEILTAAHLVETADAVLVQFSGGETAEAKVIASEPAADVALLKLNGPPPAGAVVARLGDSDRVEVGDQVFVVGAPHGVSYTLTVGYVSARRRLDTRASGLSSIEFFQTDAAINQGNSGGPMFNMAGEVVGIVSAIISKSGGSEGLGFAATSNMARRLLLDQRSFWGGLSGVLLAGDSARIFNVPPPGVGMLVQHVARGSPAAAIGLQGGSARATIEGENLILGGDIVLAVQGIPLEIGNYERIRAALSRLGPGESIRVRILRKGEQFELKAVVAP